MIRNEIRVVVEAGETRTVDIDACGMLVFDFDYEAMDYSVHGSHLVISSPEGGSTILKDYADMVSKGNSPTIKLQEEGLPPVYAPSII